MASSFSLINSKKTSSIFCPFFKTGRLVIEKEILKKKRKKTNRKVGVHSTSLQSNILTITPCALTSRKTALEYFSEGGWKGGFLVLQDPHHVAEKSTTVSLSPALFKASWKAYFLSTCFTTLAAGVWQVTVSSDGSGSKPWDRASWSFFYACFSIKRSVVYTVVYLVLLIRLLLQAFSYITNALTCNY